ncbi:MAG: methionine synthase [Oscillospiraceae bacterium]|nr:methionine synthase [Oscillospiraceae bacterium]
MSESSSNYINPNLSTIDREQAFRYMGFQENPDQKFLDLAEICEKKLLQAIRPKYTWKLFTRKDLEFLLTGKDIQKHLKNCNNIILFCATLSQNVDTCIRLAQTADVLAGMMTDAMASALTEQFCDLAESEILRNFLDDYATFRFSPGYGDFPLSVQSDILTLLQAQKTTGICLTESNLMTPRKSVTALIGLSDQPIEKNRKGCAGCNLSQKCPYRRKGVHCN